MLLAVETSARAASVALGPLGGPHVLRTLESGHSEGLAAAVAELLEGGAAALTHYALGIGPGSFTGLRVGLCFLKGFALVHPRPAVAISSFRVVAEQVRAAEPALSSITIVLDARNGEVLAGRYREAGGVFGSDPELPDGLYRQDALDELLRGRAGPRDLLAGEGASLSNSGLRIVDSKLWVPRADTLAALASQEIGQGRVRDLLGLEPTYLQKPTAERRRAEARD